MPSPVESIPAGFGDFVVSVESQPYVDSRGSLFSWCPLGMTHLTIQAHCRSYHILLSSAGFVAALSACADYTGLSCHGTWCDLDSVMAFLRKCPSILRQYPQRRKLCRFLAVASVSVAMALAVGKQARADAAAVATWPSGHMDGDVRMGCCELAILEVRMIEVAVVPR